MRLRDVEQRLWCYGLCFFALPLVGQRPMLLPDIETTNRTVSPSSALMPSLHSCTVSRPICRKISNERRLMACALGYPVRPRCRSTMMLRKPYRASKSPPVNPVGPHPTISTVVFEKGGNGSILMAITVRKRVHHQRRRE